MCLHACRNTTWASSVHTITPDEAACGGVQAQEDVEESQWNYQEHPQRHGVPGAHCGVKHPTPGAWLEQAHCGGQVRPSEAWATPAARTGCVRVAGERQ